MADSYFHELAQELGQLKGTLSTFMETWRSQDNAAALGRRVVYDKIELLTVQIQRLATDIQNVQQDVAELKKEVDEKAMPVVDAIRIERERKVGAKGVWILIGSGIMMAISAATYIIDKAIALFSHRPP